MTQIELSRNADFLSSLEVPEPEASLRRVMRAATGTCDWILDSEEFQTWRHTARTKGLWLWGPPGIGKTTILRHLVEHLRKSFQREESQERDISSVIFSFASSDQASKSSEESLLKSILYQALDQNEIAFRYFKEDDMKRYVYQETSDPLHLLWSFTFAVLQRTKNRRFWIILDGMDEIPEEARHSFLQQLGHLMDQDVGNKLKVLFSSRMKFTEPSIRSYTLSMQLQGRKSISEDIHRFVSAQVGDLCSEGHIPWRYQTQIEDALLSASGSNFLQIRLAWKAFASGVTYWSPQVIKNRLDAIKKITAEAEAYYCSLLAKVPEDSRAMAKAGFTWVLGARKLLTVRELQHAVAISADQSSWSDLVNSVGFNFDVQFDQAFGYLLRVDHEKHVHFIHQTVKDLLTTPSQSADVETSGLLSHFHIQQRDIDAALAKACIVVLSFHDFIRLRDIAQEAFSQQVQSILIRSKHPELDPNKLDFSEYDDDDGLQGPVEDLPIKELKRSLSSASLGDSGNTLLSYCVAHWNYHCVEGGSSRDVVQSLTSFVLLRQSHFFHLIAMILGIAAIHDGKFWSQVNQFARLPPLHFLMRIGDHPLVLQNLIAKGEDIDTRDCNELNPLAWAALEERHKSLELILSCNDVVINEKLYGQDNVLHLCCRAHTSLEILQRIIDDPRIDINSVGNKGQTVLHLLMSEERTQPLAYRVLARKDLDVNTVDQSGSGYLDQAFHDGRFEALVLAITSRHDVPVNWYKKTPRQPPIPLVSEWRPKSYLEMAGILGWYRVEDSILQQQPAQALRQGSSDQSLLETYAFYGLEGRLHEILRMIPKATLDSVPSFNSRRFLFLCAQQDWVKIVIELIINLGIDDSVKDEQDRTLIHWAADLNWSQIERLIENKPVAWLNAIDQHGQSALHIAAEARNERACRALLNAGADWRLRDKYRRLPAYIAAEHGHRNILLCLLEYPISPTDHDLERRQLLHYLVMWHPEPFLRQCLKVLTPNLNVVDKRRRTPLHYAVLYSNSGAVKALLHAGAAPDLRDASGFTALHYALIDGALPSVQALLDAKADLYARDTFQRNALQLAIRSENSALLDFVMKKLSKKSSDLKAAVMHEDIFGRTVLHGLAAWGVSLTSVTDDVDEEEAFLLELELDDIVVHHSNGPDAAAIKRYTKVFLALGADINAQDKHFRTALHTAVYNTSLLAVNVFLSLATDIELDMEDSEGCTVLDRAVNEGQDAVVERLQAANAPHSRDWRSKIKPLYAPWQDTDELESQAPEQAEWHLVTLKNEEGKG